MLAPAAMRHHAALAEALVKRGYAEVPQLLDTEALSVARASVERVVTQLAPPTFYAQPPLHLAHSAVPAPVMVTSVGLVIPRIHAAAPALAPLVLRPPVLAPVRALLGADARLEVLGAVVSDEARPFFTWHTHIDREEEGVRFQSGVWPDKPQVERVLVLVYLDDLDDNAGQLLVYPRERGARTAPPHDIHALRWPGEVALSPSAGDAVILEQCTWHAARPRQTAGRRSFIACYFASPSAARVDPEDAHLQGLLY